MNLEAPRTLPVGHLSHSSIGTYLDCPERWRRRYLDREYEPTNGNMLLGKAVGRSITLGYLSKQRTGHVNYEELADTFSDQWKEATEDTEIQWEDDEDASEPGRIKDQALACLDQYAITLMATTNAVSVEEGFSITLPHTDWDTIGFIDLIDDRGDLADTKTAKKRKSQTEIDSDDQGTLYLAAKRIQEPTAILPAYRWHSIKRPSPKGRSPATVDVLTTARTTLQINSYLEKIALVAREIEWRTATGNWQGAAPGNWRCSAKGCGYWNVCKFGGAR